VAVVDRERRAHATREVQAIVVRVSDHDITRADEPAHRGGHAADGPGPGHQDVLPRELERERAVYGIPKRVETRADLVGHARRKDIGVRGRHADVVGERARSLHTDPLGVPAEVALPCATVPAVATRDMSLDRDALAGGEAGDLASDLDDLAHEFVT